MGYIYIYNFLKIVVYKDENLQAYPNLKLVSSYKCTYIYIYIRIKKDKNKHEFHHSFILLYRKYPSYVSLPLSIHKYIQRDAYMYSLGQRERRRKRRHLYLPLHHRAPRATHHMVAVVDMTISLLFPFFFFFFFFLTQSFQKRFLNRVGWYRNTFRQVQFQVK